MLGTGGVAHCSVSAASLLVTLTHNCSRCAHTHPVTSCSWRVAIPPPYLPSGSKHMPSIYPSLHHLDVARDLGYLSTPNVFLGVTCSGLYWPSGQGLCPLWAASSLGSLSFPSEQGKGGDCPSREAPQTLLFRSLTEES
jgi:hypothetical protein